MKRIQALDVLRGITIAGMLLVNNPGTWSHIYAPLRHAEWNGLTPTDLVFPFFMFIMGISTYISLKKYDFKYSHATILKIIRRTIVIFLVGVFTGWFSRFCSYWAHPNPDLGFLQQLWKATWNFEHMRILGVLQRLALCYGFVSIIAITVNHKRIPYIIGGLLIVYAIILLTGNGYVYDGTVNILGRVDAAILTPDHMYKDNGIDPEGILSTIPSVAHVLIGFLVGKMVINTKDDLRQLMLNLFILGTILTFCGFLLQYGLPINKKVWSPSFVLTTCGLASSALSLMIWLIDIKGWKKWSLYFNSFGVNPLFMYVMGTLLSILLSRLGFQGWLVNDVLIPTLGELNGSLAYALLFNVFVWCIGYPLYKNKIYIKI